MKIIVKQLKLNGENISPMVISDSVLVKLGTLVITLTEALKQKHTIITPEKSGLTIIVTPLGASITHSNSVNAVKIISHLKIAYDENGHIISSKPIGVKSIYVQNQELLNSESENDESLSFGDDFSIDTNKNIHLTWQTT